MAWIMAWIYLLMPLLTSGDVGKPKYPVVIVPGMAASVLDGKLNRPSAAEWFQNQPGVEIRPHDFEGLEGIASLDPAEPKLTATYLPLIKALESVGYRAQESLWGAPYDWRFAADELAAKGVAQQMRELVEKAVQMSHGFPAVVVAHSMGNLLLARFLDLWGKDWVEKHVKSVVSVSAPWGGSVRAIKGTVSGDNFGLPFPHDLLHSLQGSAPSGPWLFPVPQLWSSNEILVRSNSRGYSAADLGQLLKDIGAKGLSEVFPKIKGLHDAQLEPGRIPVPLLCVHGNGLPTAENFMYPTTNLSSADLPEPYTVETSYGDGTVNLRSLQACKKLGPKDKTTVVEVPGASHLGVLSSRQFYEQLGTVLELPMIGYGEAAIETEDKKGARHDIASLFQVDPVQRMHVAAMEAKLP